MHGRAALATLNTVKSTLKSNASTQSSDICERLESWYLRDANAEVRDALRRCLEPLLDHSFGYHVAQVGPLPGLSLIEESPINHRVFLSSRIGEHTSLRCHADELPLESDSIDMLVAFHALEFEEHPHATLREMHRVLRPHGHLALIGFNPYSLLGLSQYVRGLHSGSAWHEHNPVSPHRLIDWLHLVDCQLEAMHYLYPLPLVGSGKIRNTISRFDQWALRYELPGGGLYVAHAIKQIAAVRPRMRLNRVHNPLAGLAVPSGPQATPRQPRSAFPTDRAA